MNLRFGETEIDTPFVLDNSGNGKSDISKNSKHHVIHHPAGVCCFVNYSGNETEQINIIRNPESNLSMHPGSSGYENGRLGKVFLYTHTDIYLLPEKNT